MRINGEVWVDETRPRLRSIRRSSVIDQWQERVNTPSRVLAPPRRWIFRINNLIRQISQTTSQPSPMLFVDSLLRFRYLLFSFLFLFFLLLHCWAIQSARFLRNKSQTRNNTRDILQNHKREDFSRLFSSKLHIHYENLESRLLKINLQ